LTKWLKSIITFSDEKKMKVYYFILRVNLNF
jgi:hypothetical protein